MLRFTGLSGITDEPAVARRRYKRTRDPVGEVWSALLFAGALSAMTLPPPSSQLLDGDTNEELGLKKKKEKRDSQPSKHKHFGGWKAYFHVITTEKGKMVCKCKMPGCEFVGTHNGGNLMKHIHQRHDQGAVRNFLASSRGTIVHVLRAAKKLTGLSERESARGHAALAIRTLLGCEPFSTVTSPAEQQYAAEVSKAVGGRTYHLPSLEAHKQHQLIVYQYFREHLHERIRAAAESVGTHALALQLDLWSDKLTRSFGALMFSFIDETWTLKSHCLSCRSFKKEHTGEEIKEWILRELGNPTPLAAVPLP